MRLNPSKEKKRLRFLKNVHCLNLDDWKKS